MPRPLPTERQRRERALQHAIARARVDQDLPKDRDVADRLGLSYVTYSKRKKDPYRAYGFELAADTAQKLKFTGKELCAICGVPYAPVEE